MQSQHPAAIEPNPEHDLLKLSPQQVQAANLLAAATPIDDVCARLNVGRTTLYRWRQLPPFAAYLNQLTRQHADQALIQSTHLLTSAMHLLQQKLADPNTPADMQLRIAFRIVALYSRPSHLRFLQSLPDDPANVESQQLRQNLQAAGFPEDSHLDSNYIQLFRGYRHDQLRQAQAFDARFGTAASTPAPLPPPFSTPAIPPQRNKMEQNGTPGASDRRSAAIDAALAGIRHGIATAAA